MVSYSDMTPKSHTVLLQGHWSYGLLDIKLTVCGRICAILFGLKGLCCSCAFQRTMYAKARTEYDACIERATTLDDFKAALNRKHMVLAPW